jgi:hypothetical protein
MTAEERAYNYASTQKPTKLQVGEIAKHYNNGYNQAFQDFLEKACVSFCKQCPWRCKYDITQGEYCKNLHDFKQTLIQE